MRPPTKRQTRSVMWCVACVPSPSPSPPPPPHPLPFNRLRYIQVKMGTAHGSSGDGSGRKPRGKKKSYTHTYYDLGRYNIIICVPVYTCIICYKGSLFTLRVKNEFGEKNMKRKRENCKTQ
jgi:hypothetical protein